MQAGERQEMNPEGITAARAATRGEWKMDLEKEIIDFNGDAVEAAELLDALMAGLENRYGRDVLRDVEYEYSQLKETLDELDRTTCKVGEEDEAYADYLARHDEP